MTPKPLPFLHVIVVSSRCARQDSVAPRSCRVPTSALVMATLSLFVVRECLGAQASPAFNLLVQLWTPYSEDSVRTRVASPPTAIIAVAHRMPVRDAYVLIASAARSAPDAVITLAISPADSAAYRAAIVSPAGGAAAAEPAPSATRRVAAWVRLYDADALARRTPEHARGLPPSIQRYFWAAMMLDDLTGGANGGDSDAGVLFSNVDAAHRAAPRAVLLSDVRDVVLQRDPFAVMWARFFGAPADALASGAWDAVAADAAIARRRPLVLAAQELAGVAVRGEAHNKEWVVSCFGKEGLAMVGDEGILCSGTTLGTRDGVRAYLAAMAEGVGMCAAIRAPHPAVGLDQGVHNVLMRTGAIAGGAAPGAEAAQARGRGRAAPALAALVRRFHDAVDVAVAAAEGDLMCTIGLPAARGVTLPRDGDGFFAALNGTTSRCAVVHQYDRERSRALARFYAVTFRDRAAVAPSARHRSQHRTKSHSRVHTVAT